MRRLPSTLRLRIALGGCGLLVAGALAVPQANALTDPCVDSLTATITGTQGDDQIIGTDGPDVIYGLGGGDVIKGLGGNDILCGGPGQDGINGGPGADRIGAGGDDDLVVGNDGDDEIWGGGGSDGLYGGYGGDTVRGDDDNEYDWLNGGPDTDTMLPGGADESYGSTPPDDACPANASRWIGVYGTDERLELADSANPCKTVSGTVTDMRNTGDGDRHFKVNGLVVELMPRDKNVLPAVRNGDVVEIRGLHVRDTWHGHLEIHPVYRIKVNGGAYQYGGPRHAGSPHKLRPDNLVNTFSKRYCWDQYGIPCAPWEPTGENFHVADALMQATVRMIEPTGRIVYD